MAFRLFRQMWSEWWHSFAKTQRKRLKIDDPFLVASTIGPSASSNESLRSQGEPEQNILIIIAKVGNFLFAQDPFRLTVSAYKEMESVVFDH